MIFSVALTIFVCYVGYNEHGLSSGYLYLFNRYNGLAQYLDKIQIFFVILDVIFIVGAISYVIKIPREKNFEMEERKKFEDEREWLWIRILIFFLATTTAFIELVSWRADNQYEIYILADAIKLFYSLTILVIFVTKENIKILLIKKYHVLRNKSERLEFINNSA